MMPRSYGSRTAPPPARPPERLARRFSQLRDDPERLVAGRDTLDVVEGIPEAALPVVPRRPRHVRRERHVLEGGERVGGGRRRVATGREARAGGPPPRERHGHAPLARR